MFYVAQLSANVQHADSGKARMDISMQGEYWQPMNSVAIHRTLARTVDLDLTANDWNEIQNIPTAMFTMNSPGVLVGYA